MTVIADSRPLRFFGLLIFGWIAFRIVTIQMSTPAPPSPGSLMPDITPSSPASLTMRPALPLLSQMPEQKVDKAETFAVRRGANSAAIFPQIRRHVATDPAGRILISEAMAQPQYQPERKPLLTPLTPAPYPVPSPPPQSSDRWRASGWLFWRDGGMIPIALSSGRLGASQAGLRLDHLLTPASQSQITAYGRVTGAFGHPVAPEAALGLSLQPVPAIPVSIAIERRAALDEGGRNANAVLIAGGFGPSPLVNRLEIEGYAQTGLVGFRSHDMFVDGKLSLLSSIGISSFRLGGAVSGGAQPDLGRLDIGPELQWRIPLPDANARIGVEWRERVAGKAHPPSGIALTLAADF